MRALHRTLALVIGRALEVELQGLSKSEDEVIKSSTLITLGRGKPKFNQTSVQPFVNFYQCIGNVGVLGFGSDSFQVSHANFQHSNHL